jgi:hypothetical protein
MKEAKDVLRIVGMILPGSFRFRSRHADSSDGCGNCYRHHLILIGLAVLLIKVAVVLAIGYLILVGIRALLR